MPSPLAGCFFQGKELLIALFTDVSWMNKLLLLDTAAAAAAAKSLQSCPTLCYPIDGSPPGRVNSLCSSIEVENGWSIGRIKGGLILLECKMYSQKLWRMKLEL